jgi:hypothetical protein
LPICLTYNSSYTSLINACVFQIGASISGGKMAGSSAQTNAFPALRLRSGASEATEIFMAIAIGMTYKDLPVCMSASGKPIAAKIDAEKVVHLFGPPTHYYFGSTDPCWLLSPDEVRQVKAGSLQSRSSRASREVWSQWPIGGLVPLTPFC